VSPQKTRKEKNMRTLNYVKVAVFALGIAMTIFVLSSIFGNSNQAYAGYTPIVTQKSKSSKIDEYWLALNLYYEAASEPRIGKIAVGIVTLNRVNDPRYPKTVKDVVTEKQQFSWYNDKIVKQPPNNVKWQECVEIAKMLLTKGVDNDILRILEGATHYHAVYVNPSWAKTKTKVVQIGQHIFYRYENNDKI
jgi:N-acetylmuramoyl-L-alanine amidase